MSILDEVGKIAGAIIAEQGVDKLDPDANLLEKAASAIAGYEAAKIAENKLKNSEDEQQTSDDQSWFFISDDFESNFWEQVPSVQLLTLELIDL